MRDPIRVLDYLGMAPEDIHALKQSAVQGGFGE